MSGESAEQQARDLLEQCGIEDAQSFSAGDVVGLANLIAKVERLGRDSRLLGQANYLMAYSASELDALAPETIIRLGNGLAAWKKNGLDWYVANDESDEFSGDAIEMCPGTLPAIVLWQPGDAT